MDGKKLHARRRSRRGVLAALAGIGASSVVGSGASGAVRPDDIERTTLGDFESGVEGWWAEGDAELTRIDREERPASVTTGDHALEVHTGTEPEPTVARRVDGTDLVAVPYLLADVAPVPDGDTGGPVTFRFRLGRADDVGGEPDVLARSPPRTLRQAVPGRLYWDASDVPRATRAAATRLDVVWSSAEDTADGTDTPGGSAVFDRVHAADAVDPVGRARLADAVEELSFAHGPCERTEVTDRSDRREAGHLVFADGATAPYRFVALADDRFRVTVGDTEARLGGGWG